MSRNHHRMAGHPGPARALARKRLLEHLSAMSRYWATVAGPHTIQERLDGLVFSALVAIDGGAAVPGYALHENGTNTLVNPADVELHDEWSKLIGDRK